MPRRTEISAGLLIFRIRGGIEVLLAHPGGPFWAKRDEAAWTIPKGVVESGDELLATAQREFTEETGLVAPGPFLPLPRVKQKSGKIVHAFACEADLDVSACRSNTFEMEWPPMSGRTQHFPEVDQVAYFDLPTASWKIHKYQKPFLDALALKLAER
jgi:predicted NUDIX family NTP pyrophosphohydrolase